MERWPLAAYCNRSRLSYPIFEWVFDISDMEAGQILVNGAQQQAASIWSPISTSQQGSYVQAYPASRTSETDFLNNNLSSTASQPQSCIVSLKNGSSRPPSQTGPAPSRGTPTPAANDDRAVSPGDDSAPTTAIDNGDPTAQSGSPLSVDSDQESTLQHQQQQQHDEQRQQFYEDHHSQNRSTVIDYVNHHHHAEPPSTQDQLAAATAAANSGNLLFDLKSSDMFGHHQQLQGSTFPYPGSGDYFSSTAAAAGLTSLQTMAAATGGAAGGIHSIFEYPSAAAAAAAMYQQHQQGHQQHVQYVDPQMAYYQPAAYTDQKLIGGQYGAGAWADATRPLTIQQYAGNVAAAGAAGYYPPTPPITSPGNGQAAYGRFAVDTGALWNRSGLPSSEGSVFLNAAYQGQPAGPADPLPHLDFANVPPSAASPSSVTSPKECVRCATYDSPVWHRQESGHYLCQNCALGASGLFSHQAMDGGTGGGGGLGSGSGTARVGGGGGQGNKSQQAKKTVSTF